MTFHDLPLIIPGLPLSFPGLPLTFHDLPTPQVHEAKRALTWTPRDSRHEGARAVADSLEVIEAWAAAFANAGVFFERLDDGAGAPTGAEGRLGADARAAEPPMDASAAWAVGASVGEVVQGEPDGQPPAPHAAPAPAAPSLYPSVIDSADERLALMMLEQDEGEQNI